MASRKPLDPLQQWYKLRNLFVGHYVDQDINKALELAATCQHPDAVWLAGIFAGRPVTTEEEVVAVLLEQGEDARALCFAGLFLFDSALLRRSAALGYGFAHAGLAFDSSGEERFLHASRAALAGDQEGVCWLAYCYQEGEGCERNLEKSRALYLQEAMQGNRGAHRCHVVF